MASSPAPDTIPPPSPQTRHQPPSSSPQSPPPIDHHTRLSRPGPARMVFYFTNATTLFWALGFLRARRLAAHQFMAENAHRLPINKAGWYLYHRAKSYRVLWRGFTGGARYGVAGGACAFVYGFVEEAWDQGVRDGRVDALGSMVAGAATAAAFAGVKRMPRRQALRCLWLGVVFGLAGGVAQDLLRWGLGAPPWYVDRMYQWDLFGTGKQKPVA